MANNEKDWTDEYVEELIKYNNLLTHIPHDTTVTRIEALSTHLVLLGKLPPAFPERYKKIYATRKRVYAEAVISAPRNKQAHAELAVVDLRQEEAEAYGQMKRWQNAFESTKEEINALKYKVKIDIEDGSNRI